VTDDYRALMQEAVRELRRARARIAELEQRGGAVAIAGIGCRLPGGIDDPDALWSFLARGGDAVGPAPSDRWSESDSAEHVPPGAFLADPFGFDAQFFRIAPREARLVDPQQRLVLEVAHATLEHAGLAPSALRGSDTGVFVGISTDDWAMHLARHLPLAEVEGASGPGTNTCAAAGRVSFTFGLQGPSLAVNTACSSSLVALHLALQALRRRECTLALVLGVNAMLSPFTTLAFQRGGMLAPDGRCKTFAATANGYGRGEGCVGVLLASQAAVSNLRLRVHAEVLGSAVNQDGATAGLTVPSGPAQQRVLRAALADAGVAPTEVQVVEAHGTGTLLGDPIELQALAAVYGAGRDVAAPLHIASVKTNFGHLEAAAGLLAVAKVALQLERRTLAPHLHFAAANPHFDWSTLPFAVPTTTTPWPARGRAIAGVSSFSFTGTNAHALLAAPAAAATSNAAAGSPPNLVLPLSARTPSALRASCARWAEHLHGAPALALVDVCGTAALGRTTMRTRAAFVADTMPALVARLAAVSRGEAADGAWVATVAAGDPPHIAVDTTSDAASIARAFVAGADVPWAQLLPPTWQRLPLPTYPFQRRPFRVFASPSPATAPTNVTAPPIASDAASVRARVAAAPPETRAALLAQHVQQTCAAVLRLPVHEVAPDEPLAEHGFDSLRAAELAQRLEAELGLALPFVELLDGATALDVGAAIARRWPAAPAAPAMAATEPAELLRRVAAMPADEVARRLREARGER
jgi:acyl transferase domain-containing protein